MDERELGQVLASSRGLWDHWGFEPWQYGALLGVRRRQAFVKDGFLGRIAEYGAVDHIVWQPGGEEEREALWRALRPLPEIMTQRFLFLLEGSRQDRRLKSFWLGFKGYAEYHYYWPEAGPAGGGRPAPPQDLAGLVDLAVRKFQIAKGVV